MPAHPERVRTASLPEGYQFGDAAGYGWAAAKDSVTGTICRVLGALGEDMANLRFRAKRGLMKKLGWFGYDAPLPAATGLSALTPPLTGPGADYSHIQHDHNCGNMLPKGSTGCDYGAADIIKAFHVPEPPAGDTAAWKVFRDLEQRGAAVFTSDRDLGDER